MELSEIIIKKKDFPTSDSLNENDVSVLLLFDKGTPVEQMVFAKFSAARIYHWQNYVTNCPLIAV